MSKGKINLAACWHCRNCLIIFCVDIYDFDNLLLDKSAKCEYSAPHLNKFRVIESA